jgi:predicted DNA-binding ribbon-helix-helix protein
LIETISQLLKEQRLTEVDLENLIAEIEDMGKNHKSALESNLAIMLIAWVKTEQLEALN